MENFLKTLRYLFFALIITITFTSPGLALDPAVFREILGINIQDLKSPSGDFITVKRILGDAKQIYTGDAAEGEGRVTYTMQDQSQFIVFSIGECHEGYTVLQTKDPSIITDPTVLEPSFTEISVAGFKLGMEKKDVELLFTEPISDGWKLDEEKKESNTHRVSFHKNITLNNGQNFCDHLWITLNFDSDARLSSFRIISGGCDDQPCRD